MGEVEGDWGVCDGGGKGELGKETRHYKVKPISLQSELPKIRT